MAHIYTGPFGHTLTFKGKVADLRAYLAYAFSSESPFDGRDHYDDENDQGDE